MVPRAPTPWSCALGGKVIAAQLVLVAVLAGAAAWLLPWIGGGFDAQQIALARRLFFILLWIVPLSGLSTYWGAVLNASNAFLAAGIAPVAIPLTTLVGLLLAPRLGITVLAWSTVAGYAAELGVLGLAMRRRRLPVVPAWHGHHRVRPLARQYGYLFAGALLMSSSLIVDQSMATWLGPGSVSVLSYGYKLVAVVLGTTSMALSTAVFPHFSELVAADDGPGITQTLAALCRTVLLASIGVAGVLICFSQPLARLLFQHGAVTAESVAAISTVQICYLLQVPVFILGVLVRGC